MRMKMMLALLAGTLFGVPTHAADMADVDNAAATPPMGWNPWNAFRTEVTEAKILAVAKKLKSSGLAAAGYRYVNVDDGWWLARRADGRILVRTSMFPSAATPDGRTSLKPFVDRLHAMGLKAGLYTDIGRNICSQAWDPSSPNLPAGARAEREVGSMDFQRQDMQLMFGELGIDYLKVDACGMADYAPDRRHVRDGTYRELGPFIVRHRPEQGDAAKVEALYASLAAEIAAVRPRGDYMLSICTWGEADAANWAGKYGQLWRTSPDIRATWESMLSSFDTAERRALYAGPGRWNDPDMLQIGNGEFGAGRLVEARAHLSLWAILGAPLLLGYDLTRSPDSLIAIAGNREAIAIDQDPAGNQGITVSRDGDAQVIVKALRERGAKAVALVNRGNRPLTVSVPLHRLRLRPGVAVRDVWGGRSERLEGDTVTRRLGPRETALLRVTGMPLAGVHLTEMTGRIRVLEDGRAGRRVDPAWVPAQVNAAPSGEPLVLAGERHDDGLGVLGNSRLQVALDSRFRTFRATVGPLDAGTTATFRVLGDGKVLAERAVAAPAGLDVPVAGVRLLELVVEEQGKAGPPVLAAWAQARLE
ncbi:NPCBM/NEW2 domain-containing protein [Pseudoduganella sp. SL102]|uniref:NPCBM/NEW2 domain-containing protein n=1 Tax=Pseudoduganella sp. SL102 TaxID=2995154 RepID=UPI00248ADE0D|nr:NPCBM/NEW2 domain-containing protein [Pseudoduganella sp. SL102]WBS00442.1 NPCBM/NEW2 domain-containing protein [Pseudoduganella sp. SL102]